MLGFCLAAGAGSRLAPLTRSLPKALLRPAGRALVDLAVEALLAAGAARVVVNAHHHAGQLAAHLAGRPAVRVAVEPRLLGTGGALAGARRAGLLGGDGGEVVLVAVVDRVVDPADLAALAALLQRSGAPMAAGLVEAGGAGVRLRPRGWRLARDPGGRWASAGLYALRAGVLDGLEPVASDLLGVLLDPLLAAGALAGMPLASPSADAGTLAGLLAVSAGLLAGRWPGRLPPGRVRAGVTAAPVFLAEGAAVDPRAVLAGPVVVDAGGRVGAGAVVSRAIVGPAAEVAPGARLLGAVLGPGARLGPGETAAAALVP